MQCLYCLINGLIVKYHYINCQSMIHFHQVMQYLLYRAGTALQRYKHIRDTCYCDINTNAVFSM
jgi:hypothetical protein